LATILGEQKAVALALTTKAREDAVVLNSILRRIDDLVAVNTGTASSVSIKPSS